MILPLASLLLGTAFAAEPSNDVLSAWSEMNHASIRVTTADDGDYQQFDYELTPQHDVRIRIEDMAHGKATKGAVMLVDGALLVKDLPLEHGEEIDAIDSPALILQVVDKLLAWSSRSPREIHGRLPLDISETARDLSVSTASAEAEYPAPWTLRGSVEAKTDGAIGFDFVHAFRTEDVPIEIHYRGVWQKSAKAVALDDAMPLAGWRAFVLGPTQNSNDTGTTILDYGATPIEPLPKTLREMRQIVRERAKARKDMPMPGTKP